MSNFQQCIFMLFGAVIALTGLFLLFYGAKKEKTGKEEGKNRIKIFGTELELATSSLVVFIVGIIIFVLPVFLNLYLRKTSPKPFTGFKSEVLEEPEEIDNTPDQIDSEEIIPSFDPPFIWKIGILDGDFSEFSVVESNRQFPWKFKAGGKNKDFPVEINDFARKKILIEYNLSEEQSKIDLILKVHISNVHGRDFKVRIQNTKPDGEISDIGILSFNGTKARSLIIRRESTGNGINQLILTCASPPQTNRWMFWDYLSLETPSS